MNAKSWSTNDAVTFWAKLGSADLNGLITFAINTNADKSDLHADTPDEVLIDVTSLVDPSTGLNFVTANTNWHKYTLQIANADTTYLDYGFYVSGDVSGATSKLINIDDIEISDANLYTITDPMTTFANSVVFTLSEAAGGEPIDFTPGIDTNTDGIFETHTNKVVINYSDSTQQVSDLAWTLTKLGGDDGDNLLNGNEKYQITIDLTYINQHASAGNKVSVNHAFTLEIKPPTGAVLTISRTMPGKIQTVNNLN
jgi:flagellin FlaB